MRPIIASLLWLFLCFAMWAWAFIGPLHFVLFMASSFVDLGAHVNIPSRQDATLGSVAGAVGISFVLLQMGGHLQFNREQAPRT